MSINEDSEKTAFTAGYGLYHFKVMLRIGQLGLLISGFDGIGVKGITFE